MSNFTINISDSLDFSTTDLPKTSSEDDGLSWSTIATLLYFGVYFALLLSLAIYIHKTEHHESAKAFLSALWDRRGIYGQLLVHLYDTATDFGVLVEWYILATDDIDYVSIDMSAMFWASIAFQITYRVLMCCAGFFVSMDDDDDDGIIPACLDAFLGCTDMYIVKTVFLSLKCKEKEPNPKQKFIQLFEAIFESLPQVVLQSVFLIRSANDPNLRDNSSLLLIATSLAASLFSISNKFTWMDKDGVVDEAQNVDFKSHCPCINWRYVLRVVWRFSFVTTRFCAISLVWAALGGAFIGIFLSVSFIAWFCAWLAFLWDEVSLETIPSVVMFGIISLIGTPVTQSLMLSVIHVLEMLALMSAISFFVFDDSIECDICADADYRQADDNKFIMLFVVVGWCTLGIDIVCYIVLVVLEIFDDEDGDSTFEVIIDGLGYKPKPPYVPAAAVDGATASK